MMDLGDHLAVPYVAVVYSVERPDGTWWRRAEYPERPRCAAEAPSAVEAGRGGGAVGGRQGLGLREQPPARGDDGRVGAAKVLVGSVGDRAHALLHGHVLHGDAVYAAERHRPL